MSIKYSTQSVYRSTPIVDNRYLDVLNWPLPPLSELNMYEIEVKPKYEHRPDLLAHDMFGDSRLWWVFAALNPDTMQDPILDLKSGININVVREFR